MFSLRMFAAWITYAAVSGVADWRLAAVVSLLVAAHEVRRQVREHGEADALTQATRWFFLALTALSLLAPNTPLHHYVPALSLATLGAAALDSLLRDRPFTLTFARRVAPEAMWEHPDFIHANVVITRVWTAAFLGSAALCALFLAVTPQLTALWVGAQVLGFVVPVMFTNHYRARVRARTLATAAR